MNTNDQILFNSAIQQLKSLEWKISFPNLGGMHNLIYLVNHTVTS